MEEIKYERLPSVSLLVFVLLRSGCDYNELSNKTASFQKEAMRTQVALWLFYEVKFV